jgi:hypothetical protein
MRAALSSAVRRRGAVPLVPNGSVRRASGWRVLKMLPGVAAANAAGEESVSARCSSSAPCKMAATLCCAALLLLGAHRVLWSAPKLAPPARWPSCRALDEDAAPSRIVDAPSAAAAAATASLLGARFALVSTYAPTHCGLATFSGNLRDGLLLAGATAVDVVAVSVRSSAAGVPYGPEVVWTIRQDEPRDYMDAAAFLADQARARHKYTASASAKRRVC